LTQKETILKSISKMDTEMLSMILDDNRTYQEATKSVLIGKLEDVFSEFKSKGDSELIPYLGYCGSEECTNQGCKGYSFFGNVSNEYISLILEEKNGEVIDIYHCLFMMPEKGYWELSNQITYTIHTDDKANFVPNIDYSINQQRCEDALIDLKESYNNRLGKEDCLYWLSKYNQLKEDISSYYGYGGFINKFQKTYNEIEHVTNYIIKEDDASHAVKDFTQLNQDDENEMLKWLVKYEQFGLDLEYFRVDTIFDFLEKIEEGYLPLKKNNEVQLMINDYQNICEFLKKFSNYYWHYVKVYAKNVKDTVEDEDFYEPDRLYLKEYLDSKNNSK